MKSMKKTLLGIIVSLIFLPSIAFGALVVVPQSIVLTNESLFFDCSLGNVVVAYNFVQTEGVATSACQSNFSFADLYEPPTVPKGNYIFVETLEVPGFPGTSICTDNGLTLAQCRLEVSYVSEFIFKNGIVPNTFIIGSAGTNFVSGSGGTGTGVVGLFASSFKGMGDVILVIIGSIFILISALMLFYWGKRKLAGSLNVNYFKSDTPNFDDYIKRRKSGIWWP